MASAHYARQAADKTAAADAIDAWIVAMHARGESVVYKSVDAAAAVETFLTAQKSRNASVLTRSKAAAGTWADNWVDGLSDTRAQLLHESYMLQAASNYPTAAFARGMAVVPDETVATMTEFEPRAPYTYRGGAQSFVTDEDLDLLVRGMAQLQTEPALLHLQHQVSARPDRLESVVFTLRTERELDETDFDYVFTHGGTLVSDACFFVSVTRHSSDFLYQIDVSVRSDCSPPIAISVLRDVQLSVGMYGLSHSNANTLFPKPFCEGSLCYRDSRLQCMINVGDDDADADADADADGVGEDDAEYLKFCRHMLNAFVANDVVFAYVVDSNEYGMFDVRDFTGTHTVLKPNPRFRSMSDYVKMCHMHASNSLLQMNADYIADIAAGKVFDDSKWLCVLSFFESYAFGVTPSRTWQLHIQNADALFDDTAVEFEAGTAMAAVFEGILEIACNVDNTFSFFHVTAAGHLAETRLSFNAGAAPSTTIYDAIKWPIGAVPRVSFASNSAIVCTGRDDEIWRIVDLRAERIALQGDMHAASMRYAFEISREDAVLGVVVQYVLAVFTVNDERPEVRLFRDGVCTAVYAVRFDAAFDTDFDWHPYHYVWFSTPHDVYVLAQTDKYEVRIQALMPMQN